MTAKTRAITSLHLDSFSAKVPGFCPVPASVNAYLFYQRTVRFHSSFLPDDLRDLENYMLNIKTYAMKRSLLIIICLLLIEVCLKGQNTTLDLIKLTKTKEFKSTTDIFELVKFVPLETIPETITKVSTTIVTRDNIYMFSNAQGCILKFDGEGKFIGKIGKQGRGPGEYLSIFNLTLFRFYKSDIYLFDGMGSKIIKYSIDGQKYQSIPLKEKPGGFISSDMLNEDCFLIARSSPFFYKSQSGLYSELLSYDSKGNLTYKFPLNPNSKNFEDLMYPSIFYHFDNRVYYKSPYCDTIFKIMGPSKRIVSYILSPGNKRIESSETKNGIAVYGLHETQRYLLIDYIFNGNKRAVYDKLNGTFFQVSSLKEAKGNNIDKCVFLWPEPLTFNESNVPGEFITYIEPSILKGLDINKLDIPSAYMKSELIKLKNRVNENDNPIIVIMREKK
jgi:hypothetical protein